MLVVAIFVLGYLAIVFERPLRVNKSASALFTGVLCWTAHIATNDASVVNARLLHALGDISQILFFLLAAMTIVELIDLHDGFEVLTSRVTTTNRWRLLYTLAAMTFFLSAVLDNLTTSILMMSLVRKLAADSEDRVRYGGLVIIAANAGGVWSPIGDVTTTMLWVGHQITTVGVLTKLFVPAVISVVVPTLWIGARMKGDVRRPGVQTIAPASESSDAQGPLVLREEAAAIGKTLKELDVRARTGATVAAITRDGRLEENPSPRDPLRDGDTLVLVGSSREVELATHLLVAGEAPKPTTSFERALVFAVGALALLFVPVFKTVTHLPPVMGILVALGAVWVVTDILHKKKNVEGKATLSVAGALQRIDASSVLFFLGILLAVSALETNGVLGVLARSLDRAIGNVDLVAVVIGLTSSIVDNVPLVAAAQGMYSLDTFPLDHRLWLSLAYCAGTGGSILIIGSAAGVAVMGIQRITFAQYLKTHSLPALVGFGAGALAFAALGR